MFANLIRIIYGVCLIALSTCTPPRVVLVDKTSLQQHTSCRSSLQKHGRGNSSALTYEERVRIERVAEDVLRAVPERVLDRVRIVIIPGLTEYGWSSGNMVRLNGDLVLRQIRKDKNEKSKKFTNAVLAFLVAHELAHLMLPPCADSCQSAFECERAADLLAERILEAGGHSYGSILSTE